MAAVTDGKSGSQYLQEVLGDVLAEALSAVAKVRPKDPVQFVAEFLHERSVKEKEETVKDEAKEAEQDLKAEAEEADSGHYEDQEAPTSGSLDTVKLDDSTSKATEKGPSTSSSEGFLHDKEFRERRNQRKQRRRRTAQSEPTPQVS